MPPRRLPAALLSCALGVGLLAGCSAPDGDDGGGSAEAPESAARAMGPDDAVAEVRQWQQDRDARARDSAMSPFTAVDSQYVSDGATVRLGADESGIQKDPRKPMVAMASITFHGDQGFTIDRLPESAPPRIHEVEADGEPAAQGSDVAAAHILGENEVASIGRYFLAMSPQSGFGRVIAYDPEAESKASFGGFLWYTADARYQVEAAWKPIAQPDEVTVATSRGLEKTFYRAGRFEFTIDGQRQALVALAETPAPQPGDSFFIPFRDATTGKETYTIGRYLNIAFLGEGEEHVIDFNRATNPLCNYSPHFNCPLPPEETTLTVAVRAGEMTYPLH